MQPEIRSFVSVVRSPVTPFDVEEKEENIDVEEREKERERGSNIRRQRLASPTAEAPIPDP